jgi:hypothetical protein
MKYTEKEALDDMLADTRIASWVRTDYRNRLDQEKPELKQSEPADKAVKK